MLLSSGRQTIFRNHVSWARTYLKNAGLLETCGRGKIRLTPRGEEVLAQNPAVIDLAFLRQFQEFQDFLQRGRDRESSSEATEESGAYEAGETPEERIEHAYATLMQELADEQLDQLHGGSPRFLEELVIELLVKMGYGGSFAEAAEAVGRTGDDGIDGVISEDRLGLDVIYIQAKRWANPVGRPEVQEFVGALQCQRARKGVFITTSSFTPMPRSRSSGLTRRSCSSMGDA